MRLRVRIDAAPDAVFQALTDADTLIEWFAESAEVALSNGRYTFWGRYTPRGDQPRQRLTSAEPGRALRFAWDLGTGAPSNVELSLRADGEQTVLDAVHTGVPAELAHTVNCFWHVGLANLVAQCEGVATMPPFDFSAPAQGDALVRTVIDVPAEEVFASLLDPAQVNKWTHGSATIQPHVGGRYEFGWDHGPGTIVELDQDKVLAYTWRHQGSPETTVRWQLRQTRGSTYLTLVHSGFADDELAEHYRQGWPAHLVEVKRILELGDAFAPMKLT
jgi:uncharacterized protein YndB with AHSA1/START domain